ncbi:DUF1858 domain-containing protein [Heliobacterium gestii]|uniref:DUF1858 domain-containing protein n=1 Tax=Heliomicrobium gestii TaxID=2699 RepID=A0A845LBB2_HELGE|nr:DUF1858 domain-containing protein [Heliomicrobium gestii]MBM7867684.1 hybrid cluster-associated redox disulfide protein [Heliomicrobium gestii]MZP44077.1 DUF1858 domain-containing protein [Heliomicrobium gestii]
MIPTGANLQKIRNGKRTYAITPHLPGGFVKPEILRKYADVAEKYGGVLKLTSAQRIMITGLKAEEVEHVWADLGMQPAMGFANCVRSIKICPGIAFCKRGKQDSIKLGLELDRLYHKKEMPSRMKIGVAGCQNSCAEVHIKDIGLLGTDSGWDVYVGGSCGAHPRLAQKLRADLTYEEVLSLVAVIVRYYQQHGEIERLGAFIDRIGWERFSTEVLALYEAESQQKTANECEAESGFNRETVREAGHGSQGVSESESAIPQGSLAPGQPIERESVVNDIIQLYPETIPLLRSFGMGCLGCPSAKGEPIAKAAEIHGIDLETLLQALNNCITNQGK